MADNSPPEEKILQENLDKANKQLQDTLDKIRSKTPEELRNDEIRFIRARISYLTGDDKEKYAKVLSEDYKLESEKKPESEAESNSFYLEEYLVKVLKTLSYPELQKQAKKLGLKVVGVSREDLEQSVIDRAKKKSKE